MSGRRSIISNQPVVDGELSSTKRFKIRLLTAGKRRKSNRPRLVVFAAYGGVFIVIISLITVGYQPPQSTAADTTVVSSAVQSPSATPDTSAPSIDQVVATDVSANVAEQTNMPIAADITNLSQSLAAKNALAQTSDSSIVKPQIVQPTLDSRGMTTYIVKSGDTITSIATQFSLKPETIQWANNITGDSVSVGRQLTILPVDGVLHTVSTGDTYSSLASAYHSSQDRIVSLNNLELSGLKPGAKIVIPDGVLPTDQRPGYVAPVQQVQQQTYTDAAYGSGLGGSSWRIGIGMRDYPGSQGYGYGECTRYAYNRRVQMGLRVGANWGNAGTWAWYAASQGYFVSRSPSVGAIMQNSGGYGHVAIVEQVKPNGDVVISEMNSYVGGGGWNIVDGRTVPANQASYYLYIH